MDVVKQETPNGNVNNPKNEISPVQNQQNPGGPKGNNKFQGGNNNQQNNQLNRKNMGNNNNNKFNNRGGKMNNVVNRNPNIKSEDFMVNQKLKQFSGPMHELPSFDVEEVKFSGRNRLYIGNLTNDVTEDELKELFKPYGEISESFINTEKNFAFLKIDYHANAEKAKKELDGTMRKNRPIRIRFAPNATTIRVKNLTPYVSNELLYKAFEIFGQVERGVIIVDDRGKPTGEGIVEFARKSGAMTAIKYCQDKCFFLTASLRPCVVEPFEHIDDTDGYPEKSLMKKNQEFFKARQSGPRFADVSSFEHEFGTRWKQLHELYKQKSDALKREMQMEEDKLEAQMEYARFEQETESLRDQLRMREQDRDRQKLEWENKERQAEEFRQRDEQQMRRQQEEMQVRMQRQDEEMRRRQQENSLFMQAQQLNNMLDQQEMGHSGNNGGNGGNNNNNNGGGNGNGAGNNNNNGGGGRKNFNNDNNDNRRSFDMMNQGNNRFNDGGNQGGPQRGGNNRPWNNNNNRQDDFQNKRRRY
ncbi:unnamed protein product [Diamesa hyperborea]